MSAPLCEVCVRKNISITGFTSLCVWFREREDERSEWMVAGFIQSLESLEKTCVFKVMLEYKKWSFENAQFLTWCGSSHKKPVNIWNDLIFCRLLAPTLASFGYTIRTIQSKSNMSSWWWSSKCAWNVLLKSCTNAVREDVCLEVTEGRIVWSDRRLYLHKVFSWTRNICPGSS